MEKIFYILLAGTMFPLCGNYFQHQWKNQLGDIYSLGLGSAACTGALIGAFIKFPIALSAVSFCVLTIPVLYFLFVKWSTEKLLTFGMVYGTVLGSLGTIIANNVVPDKLMEYYHWAGTTFTEVPPYGLLSVIFVVLGLLLLRTKFSFIGVNLVAISLIYVCGIVWTISLVAPNLARLYTKTSLGANSKQEYILSSVIGVLMLLLAYCVSLLLPNLVVPISAVVSLIGAPIFIILNFKNNEKIKEV